MKPGTKLLCIDDVVRSNPALKHGKVTKGMIYTLVKEKGIHVILKETSEEVIFKDRFILAYTLEELRKDCE